MDEDFVQGYWHDELPQVQTWDHNHQPTPSYQMLSRTNNQEQEHPKRLKRYNYLQVQRENCFSV